MYLTNNDTEQVKLKLSSQVYLSKQPLLSTHRKRAGNEQFDDIRSQCVSILVQEAIDVVPDRPRIVPHPELWTVESWSAVQLVESVIVVAFLEERKIRGTREVGFIVQEM